MSSKNLKLFRDASWALSLAGVAKKNGRFITEADLGVMKKPVVLVEEGRLVWIGTQSQLPKKYHNKISSEVSLKGLTLLPGLVDCHTHTVFAGSRAAEYELRNQGISYQEITRRGGGIHSTVRKVRKALAKDLISTSEEKLKSFLAQGVTLVEIKSGYGLNSSAELKTLKVIDQLKTLRVVSTFLGAHALPQEFSSHGAYLEHILTKVAPRVLKETRCRRADIFIEKGFFEPQASRLYLETLQKRGFALAIHADQLSASGGTRLAIELGALSADHAIHLDNATIQKLAKSEVTAVLLPAADLYMKCPYPPARKILDQGGRIALSTDFNPGSSPTQDMALVGFLARQEMKMSLPEVIAATTWNAARALNLHERFGSLEVGKAADFAGFEMDWEHLFYSVGGQWAQQVFIEGRRRL